jgi:hypothetical protein
MWTQGIGSTRRRLLRAIACAGVPVMLGMPAPAIGQDVKPGAGAPPAARAEDVRSIDAILASLYATISGPAGPRDWDRLRGLCLPGARLIPCRRAAEGTVTARVLSVEEFIKTSEPALRQRGFFEREIHRRVERFGAVAHVFSTYESRHAAGDAEPFARGINSIQLFHDGARWWIVTIFWDAERPDQPIPADYLPPREPKPNH